MTLPTGFRVRLARGIQLADGGRLLVGGSPLTAMRLSERAIALLRSDAVTVTDPATAHLADRLVDTNLGVPDLTDVPPASPHELTVVIPVRDLPAQLDRALAALHPLHCVVVDDDASLRPHLVAEVAGGHGADPVALPANVGPADPAVALVGLAVRGLGWAVRQEAGLLLRHWWPAAALGAVGSRHVRRALTTALVVDTAVMVSELRGSPERVHPVTALAGRRLDDLAYGAGLWWGALRARSARVLVPRRPGPR